MRIKATIVAYAFSVQYFENVTIVAYVGLRVKQRKKTQIIEFTVATYDVYSGSHIRSPQPNWKPPLAPFHKLWIYMVDKKHSGKADQSTLVSGGSEHA